MKTRVLATIILLTTFFVGCKDEKKSDSLGGEASKSSNNFKVTVNMLVKKDDNFSIFYNEDGSTDFTKIQPIWVNVKGSDQAQDIVFNLPEDVVPAQIRLDFGISKDQEEMIINKFRMDYLGKSFETSGENFYIYFDPDKSKTIFDKDKKTINAVVNNGQRQFPSFFPNVKPLGDEIAKIVK